MLIASARALPWQTGVVPVSTSQTSHSPNFSEILYSRLLSGAPSGVAITATTTPPVCNVVMPKIALSRKVADENNTAHKRVSRVRVA